MRRRWWIVLVVAFAACLGLVAAQGARPWDRFAERTLEFGQGSSVDHAGVSYRLVIHEVADAFATDDDPRTAIPGARLVKVVVEQRATGPEPVWEFCTLRLGTRDGLVWADQPEGYDRPPDVPRDSSCATDDDVPAPGDVHRFGKVFMLPAEYAESADVLVGLPEGRIRLTPRR